MDNHTVLTFPSVVHGTSPSVREPAYANPNPKTKMKACIYRREQERTSVSGVRKLRFIQNVFEGKASYYTS